MPASKVAELDKRLEETTQSNVVSKKSLRTLIGKAMATASMLFVWRPFISELYVALQAEQPMRQMGEFGRSKLHTLCNGCEPSWLARKLASSDATLWGPSATRAPKSSSHGMRRHLAWEVHSKYKAPLNFVDQGILRSQNYRR